MDTNTITKINAELTNLIAKIEESGPLMTRKELDLICLARDTIKWINSNPSKSDITRVVNNLNVHWMTVTHVDMVLYKYLS